MTSQILVNCLAKGQIVTTPLYWLCAGNYVRVTRVIGGSKDISDVYCSKANSCYCNPVCLSESFYNIGVEAGFYVAS